jgi:hypothetical protein
MSSCAAAATHPYKPSRPKSTNPTVTRRYGVTGR